MGLAFHQPELLSKAVRVRCIAPVRILRAAAAKAKLGPAGPHTPRRRIVAWVPCLRPTARCAVGLHGLTLLRLSAPAFSTRFHRAVRGAQDRESRQAHRVERLLAAMPAYAGGLRSNSTNVIPCRRRAEARRRGHGTQYTMRLNRYARRGG